MEDCMMLFGKSDKTLEKEVTLKCSMCGKTFKKTVKAQNAAGLAQAVATLKKGKPRCDDCQPDRMGSGGSW